MLSEAERFIEQNGKCGANWLVLTGLKQVRKFYVDVALLINFGVQPW